MQFNPPEGIAIDSNDYLSVSDQTALDQITPEGEVFTIDKKGVLYVIDEGAKVIKRETPAEKNF